PSQKMEKIRRGCAVRDAQISARAQLKKSLDPTGRMIRTLPFLTMRQEQCECGRVEPFVMAACNKLIDDHLRDVGEVAKLRLPYDQASRRLERVAVLKTQHRVLRKRTADDRASDLSVTNPFKR